MSDDAPTPAGDAARDPWPAPASEEADGPQDAAPKVPLHKAATGDGAGVSGPGGPAGSAVESNPWAATGDGAGVSGPGGPAGSPVEPNPWAAPEDRPQSGPGQTVGFSGPPASAPGSPDQAPPAVHDQWTVTALPGATPPPADAGPRPWATPVGTPPANGPFASFPPPHPGTAAAGGPPANPFAPPAPGAAVPPPPLAPHGPGPAPYGYPGGPVGYPGPGGPGYGYPSPPPPYGGAPGPYGWYGGPVESNGMGVAALVLGIASAVLFCMWPLAIIAGILGVVFGSVGRGKARRGEASNAGQALAGIICGAVGIVLGIGLGVLLIVQP
ncbi:DUF4190 domain-containing protein [Streptomyces sp. NBC_00377]|uniref:DUF4190 domain-containing protein n=1 Tax=unclassified Streptomyces TaxID=2593676 RepID=UPI002E1F5875|nr:MULTISPECIES: DUF4190 domain-containing protein [unclassified Streptomyces]